MNTITASNPSASKGIHIGLWLAQTLMALLYIPAGLGKLTQPLASLALQMPWVMGASEQFVRFVGLVDLAAGLGLLLPALTRIAPRLIVWAAMGSAVLQLFAMSLHISRGEFEIVPINLLVIALSVFVAWGRSKRAPIQARF